MKLDSGIPDSGTPWTAAGLSLQVDHTQKSLRPTAAARSKAVETVPTMEENGFVALALNEYVLKESQDNLPGKSLNPQIQGMLNKLIELEDSKMYSNREIENLQL